MKNIYLAVSYREWAAFLVVVQEKSLHMSQSINDLHLLHSVWSKQRPHLFFLLWLTQSRMKEERREMHSAEKKHIL